MLKINKTLNSTKQNDTIFFIKIKNVNAIMHTVMV